MSPEGRERPAGEPGGAEPEASLAESIDRLFQGMEGGAGVLDAADPAPPEEAARAAPAGAPTPAEAAVETSRAEAVVEPAAPLATEHPPGGPAAAPGEPAATPAADEAQDLATELDRTVTVYLERSAPEHDELPTRIESLIRRLEAAHAPGGAAGVLTRLALAEDAEDASVGEAEDGPLALARRLLSPALARSLAERLGAEARDEEARGRGIRAVARLSQGMAGALAAALTDATERVARRAYLDALVALGDDALPLVEAMTTDSRWFVVRNALLVLRELAGERALEHFTVALAHSDPRVRREALRSLAHVGGDSATLLVPSGLADPDREVRQAAAMAVGALRADRAVKALLERLEKEDEADVQIEILRALGQIGDPGAVSAIEKRAEGSLFSRPPTAVRVAAYRALWAIGTPHARKCVEAAASDRDAEVRHAVAQTLSASPTR